MARRRRWLVLALGCVAMAAAGALVAVAYRSDLAAARARIEGRSAIASTPCGDIEYAEEGVGPPVLVVHGAGGGFDQGLEAMHGLAARGYRIIAVSRFGYLRTPLPPDASAQSQADAHACLLDALDIERAAVIGASAGAPSALQFALRHPDRTAALVLLVPAAYVPRPGADAPLVTPPETPWLFDTALDSDFLFWLATKLARNAMLRGLLATPPELVAAASSDEQARVHAMLENILPVRPRRLGLLNDAAVTSTLPRYALEQVAAPTLAIAAADDGFGTDESARYSAAHIPDAELLVWPSGGHVLVGHDAETTDAIARFLATRTAPQANRPAPR